MEQANARESLQKFNNDYADFPKKKESIVEKAIDMLTMKDGLEETAKKPINDLVQETPKIEVEPPKLPIVENKKVIAKGGKNTVLKGVKQLPNVSYNAVMGMPKIGSISLLLVVILFIKFAIEKVGNNGETRLQLMWQSFVGNATFEGTGAVDGEKFAQLLENPATWQNPYTSTDPVQSGIFDPGGFFAGQQQKAQQDWINSHPVVQNPPNWNRINIDIHDPLAMWQDMLHK